MGGLLSYKYRSESLTHEAGHVLGLVRRESRINGHHCPAQRCVMASVSQNVKGDILTWLESLRPAIEAAKQDPVEAVRWLALQLESAVQAKLDRRDPDKAAQNESSH